jgi:hypothetical protein
MIILGLSRLDVWTQYASMKILRRVCMAYKFFVWRVSFTYLSSTRGLWTRRNSKILIVDPSHFRVFVALSSSHVLA